MQRGRQEASQLVFNISDANLRNKIAHALQRKGRGRHPRSLPAPPPAATSRSSHCAGAFQRPSPGPNLPADSGEPPANSQLAAATTAALLHPMPLPENSVLERSRTPSPGADHLGPRIGKNISDASPAAEYPRILPEDIHGYSENLDSYLDKLQLIIDEFKNESVILAGDFNARSTLWYDKVNNDKGKELTEFIIKNNLNIINKDSKLTTFETINGKSNIDLTLANDKAVDKVINWKISNNVTSDHNLINFCYINKTKNTECTPDTTRIYNLKKANWAEYIENLHQVVNESHEDINNISIEDIIHKCALKSIPKIRNNNRKCMWWNKELNKMKREIIKNRKALYKNNLIGNRQELEKNYRELRNKYKSAIRDSKTNSWKTFIENEAKKGPWSMPYKIVTEKIHTKIVLSSIKKENLEINKLEQLPEYFLDKLFPTDNIESETVHHKELRKQIEKPHVGSVEEDLQDDEIVKAIHSLGKGKAPGEDGINLELIQKGFPVIKNRLCNMFREIYVSNKFPEKWKTGIVKILVKSKDKDPTKIKSYRPICLLPVLGKIYEKIILNKLHKVSNTHPNQYGFTKNRSTIDALQVVKEKVRNTRYKYLLGIFVDIKGAFDNVRWPSILSTLKQEKCPTNIFNIVNDYFINRKCKVILNKVSHLKNLTKGCPQGSVLGPYFWNKVIDQFLEMEKENYLERIAYADDLLIMIEGKSRAEIESRSIKELERLSIWCRNNKLELSKEKTQTMWLKGSLDSKRAPKIKFEGSQIKMVDNVKYLGVNIGKGFNFGMHISNTVEKTMKAIYCMNRICRKQWGFNSRLMLTLYKGLIESIILYGSEIWGELINQIHRNKLLRLQRNILIIVSKAYRTVSTDALPVITGILPIDIKAKERCLIYAWNKSKMVRKDKQNIREENKREAVKIVRNEMVKRWQERWNVSEKGRWTFSLIRKVKINVNYHLDYYMTQILTGHGNFNQKLASFKLTDKEVCECGQIDDVKHLLLNCPLNEDIRINQLTLVIKDNWKDNLNLLTEKHNLKQLSIFINQSMKKRDALREESRKAWNVTHGNDENYDPSKGVS
ncbi:hypothetical protein J437_LFUL007396 [Ladona fulva]|uniref:Reverse transcriptase domain-containing protein n=1 Tax=Ladona fulva TaxID=123851 RepID=A0A8K0P006_LADFU|nr:hypothetical protein J437_LFUL007396 [Ladona fulva]